MVFVFQNISGSQILIFNSGRLQICRHISLVGIYVSNEATKLMFCQIYNLTVMNIRICDPQLVNKKVLVLLFCSICLSVVSSYSLLINFSRSTMKRR